MAAIPDRASGVQIRRPTRRRTDEDETAHPPQALDHEGERRECALAVAEHIYRPGNSACLQRLLRAVEHFPHSQVGRTGRATCRRRVERDNPPSELHETIDERRRCWVAHYARAV